MVFSSPYHTKHVYNVYGKPCASFAVEYELAERMVKDIKVPKSEAARTSATRAADSSRKRVRIHVLDTPYSEEINSL